MFIRHADFTIDAWYNERNIFDLQNDWKEVVRSGHICGDGDCLFVKETQFDYDPEHFLYYRARAITADIPNGNGDLFPYDEIKKSYHTFIGRGIYLNHHNENPDLAFGIILDAVFHGNIKPAYVEILGAIDKELAEQKHPGLIRQISSGIINSTSMSCICQEAECGVPGCHNRAKTEEELCIHMNPGSKDKPNPFYVKGRKFNGSLAFEINYGITFTEDSIVGTPADPTARVFEVWASLHKNPTFEEIKQKLAELNKIIQDCDKYKA